VKTPTFEDDLRRYGNHVRTGDFLSLKAAVAADPKHGPLAYALSAFVGTIFPALVLTDPAVPPDCVDFISGGERRRFRFDGTEMSL